MTHSALRFRARFDPLIGRPSIPVETCPRMMLVYCGIGIDARVVHPTALMKIIIQCGEITVPVLNEALIARAVGAESVKTGKVRADTTVVSANARYLIDSNVLLRGAQTRQEAQAT